MLVVSHPFGYISSSDHRSIYIDINLVQYLRNPFIDINVNNSRLLQSNHSSKIRKYKKHLISFMRKRNIISTAKDMQHKLNKRILSHQDMIQIDKTDNTLMRGMIKIENTHKADLYNSPWSIVLSNHIRHMSYWRLAVFQILKQLSHIARLQKIAMQLPPLYDVSISTVRIQMRKDVHPVRNYAKQFPKTRRQHLIARTTVLELNRYYK